MSCSLVDKVNFSRIQKLTFQVAALLSSYMYPSTEGLVLWRRACVLTKGSHSKRLPLGLQQSILLQHYSSYDILMLSLVTLSATFPNVYGPAIFQQQQLQRQPQKEGKMYKIKSSKGWLYSCPKHRNQLSDFSMAVITDSSGIWGLHIATCHIWGKVNKTYHNEQHKPSSFICDKTKGLESRLHSVQRK